MTAESDRQRALLRQLRDLDDDRAAGKITDDDHRRLRAPLERAAAATLHPAKPPAAADIPTRRPGATETPTRGPGATETPTRGRGAAETATRGRGDAETAEAAATPRRGRGRVPERSSATTPEGAENAAAGAGKSPAAADADADAAAGAGGSPAAADGAVGRRGTAGGRRRRRVVTVLAAAAAVASVAVLLAGAIAPRGAGETVSGDAPAAAATASPGAPAGGSAAQPADPPAGSPAGPAGPATGPTGAGPTGAAGAGPTGAAGAGPTDAAQTATPEQAAAIDTAALDVKAHPKDIAKHITLAHAYADGGEGQLAAVEYLAILRLDPGNAEANTALALLAFEVGQPQQAKDMLDAVLAADPAYPEALYVRGLVLLSGLHQPAAATRDLHAYLSAAPYGSHRTAAETLLALAGSTP